VNAFTNPSTNSYKRLVPGLRGAGAARLFGAQPLGVVPHPVRRRRQGQARRGALPRCDRQSVPRLCGAADGGLDGIDNKIHPGEAMDKNLYDLPPEELKEVPTVCGSLREALEVLDANRAFLLKGGVFTDDQIDAYIELKWAEVARWEMTPSPVEFDMYYSA
jgi:glutamine synthetase